MRSAITPAWRPAGSATNVPHPQRSAASIAGQPAAALEGDRVMLGGERKSKPHTPSPMLWRLLALAAAIAVAVSTWSARTASYALEARLQSIEILLTQKDEWWQQQRRDVHQGLRLYMARLGGPNESRSSGYTCACTIACRTRAHTRVHARAYTIPRSSTYICNCTCTRPCTFSANANAPAHTHQYKRSYRIALTNAHPRTSLRAHANISNYA
eukprot:1198425-Pleurochrysis_carterae.AAC.3